MSISQLSTVENYRKSIYQVIESKRFSWRNSVAMAITRLLVFLRVECCSFDVFALLATFLSPTGKTLHVYYVTSSHSVVTHQ